MVRTLEKQGAAILILPNAPNDLRINFKPECKNKSLQSTNPSQTTLWSKSSIPVSSIHPVPRYCKSLFHDTGEFLFGDTR